jgi:hypothetical protein
MWLFDGEDDPNQRPYQVMGESCFHDLNWI